MRAFALGLALALAACTTPQAVKVGVGTADAVGVAPPVTYASKTVLDEKAVTSLTLAYTFAAKGATQAIKLGIVSDPTTIARIGVLDDRAYAAVLALRSAYLAGNAASYAAAYDEASAALAQLKEAF